MEQAGSSSEVAEVMHPIRSPSLSSLSLPAGRLQEVSWTGRGQGMQGASLSVPFATFASYAARIPPMRVSSACGKAPGSVADRSWKCHGQVMDGPRRMRVPE